MLGVGLLPSVAELQHDLARGGPHPWEPFLWELRSVLVAGGLGLLVHRWHVQVLRQPRPLLRLALHGAGALVYVLLHVLGMFALRWTVYGLAGVGYEPGSALQILAYEAGKDLVSCALMCIAAPAAPWRPALPAGASAQLR